ncbi:MAG: CoA ester lyase [Limibacillus sp.]|jgi:citrate lyase subunit beta/citryl-CoA lyase
MDGKESGSPLPTSLARCWLFVPAGEAKQSLKVSIESGADVLIAELEDFTAPERRAGARADLAEVLAAWKQAGLRAAVRINPLETEDGPHDLAAAMAAGAEVIALPKCDTPQKVRALGEAVGAHEGGLGIEIGSTELLPNIESAAGLIRTFEIAQASPRVRACLVASEDMAADLQSERGRDGLELSYVRQRFLVECRAAGVEPVDCPFTWTNLKGVEADALFARRLGYNAKSAVAPEHAHVIRDVMTPSNDGVERARRIVAAFDEARAKGEGRVELDGSLVELPIYSEARRLLERAALFGL